MPYYYRRRNWRRPYRRRRFWTRRFRSYFPRRRRWRRRYRVRRKLQKIKIQQYQPETINKCKIKGIQPIIISNAKRLANNFRQYEQSIIYHHQPGGGGFSITKYTLDALFEQHQLVRNWWTRTNNNLPLCRYTGCKLKLYKSENVDYVITPFTCYPMLATSALYTSCQPSIQLMNPDSIKVPSKRTNPKGRPYKIVKFKPPAQLTNKWYFTKDLSTTGLLLTTAALCSFDHYFVDSRSESNNMGFYSLNTKFFNMRNFEQPGTEGYKPYTHGTTYKTLWAAPRALPNHNIDNIQMSELIYLGNTSQVQQGQQVGNSLVTYLANYKNWGNVFYHQYIKEEVPILVSTKSLEQLKTSYNTNKNLSSEDFQYISQPLLVECRYTPDRDKGKDNRMYLLTKVRENTPGWDPPASDKLQIWGFPMWLLSFGWLDWLKQSSAVVHLETNWLITIQSKFITPELSYYVPIDKDFLDNKSPYTEHEGEIFHSDSNNWNPQVKFQQQTLENFVQTGPGTAKLGTAKSVEVKCEYSFYFKFGGCPPKMDKITDPTTLPTYPLPNNNQELYSFQNPNTNPETYLYHFDTRQDIITEKAAKRIKRDLGIETALLPITGKMQPATALPDDQTDSSEESTSEKEEEALYQQLQQCRRKRKRLQLRLLQLMKQE